MTCFIKHEDGKIEVLKESECEAIEPKPEVERKCNIRPCEGVDWITSEWGGVRNFLLFDRNILDTTRICM